MLHSLADSDIMTTSQVNAAKILLNKVIPDMKAIEHSGEVDGNITFAKPAWLK